MVCFIDKLLPWTVNMSHGSVFPHVALLNNSLYLNMLLIVTLADRVSEHALERLDYNMEIWALVCYYVKFLMSEIQE